MSTILPTLPTGEAAPPTVPRPDLVAEGTLQAQGQIAGGLHVDLWSSFWAALAKGFVWAMRGMSQALSAIVALVMQGFTAGQGMDSPEFDDAVAAVMSDLMGVQFSSALIKQARARGGTITEMRTVGATFLNQLLSEFGVNIDLNTQAGAAPALAFLGFVMAFAVRQGNIAFLSELLTLRYGEQFRAYGEGMANNLSLGRLSRLALRPIMDDLVAKPLQDTIRQVVRPTDLNAAEAVRAFNRGSIDQATLTANLARLGYADSLHQVLVDNTTLSPNADEILSLFRWGKIDQPTRDSLLQRAGFPPDFIAFLQTSRDVQRADTAISDYLSTLRALVKDHRLDSDAYRTLLQELPIPEDQRVWELRIGGLDLEFPTRRLSLAQMRDKFFEGIIALEDFAAWTESEGYSVDDQRILLLDLLHDSPLEEDKKMSAALAEKLKDITIAKKAAKAGISLTQFQGLGL